MNNINPTSGGLYSPLYHPFDELGSGGGGDWNERTSRRRFLKRTGAATAATLIAWHASAVRSYADPAEDPPVEIVVTIPAGSSVTYKSDTSDPGSLAGASVTKRDKLNSGESFTPWNSHASGGISSVFNGDGTITFTVTGPGTITFTRSKEKK